MIDYLPYWCYETSFADGEPGDLFMCMGDAYDETRWTIYKFIDGKQLELAHELGYRYNKIVAPILSGDKLNPAMPHRTDELDPLTYLDVEDPMFSNTKWAYLGRF